MTGHGGRHSFGLPNNNLELLIDSNQLSYLDHALALELLTSNSASHIRGQHVAMRLQGILSEDYIQSAGLAELFLALSALQAYDAALIPGDCLAWAVKRLVQAEECVGGPYREAGKVDLAANACIALFMKRAATPLPNVDAFLKRAIESQQISHEIFSDDLLRYLFAQCYPQVTVPIFFLQRIVRPKGLDMYKGQSPESQIYLAAAIQIKNELAKAHIKLPEDDIAATYALRQAAIMDIAQSFFQEFDLPLRDPGLAALERIAKADKHFEITMIAAYLYESLKRSCISMPLSNSQLTSLGLANVYNWTGYMIYDDFLDAEGQLEMLPVAHAAVRAARDIYNEFLPSSMPLKECINRLYIEMDAANAWEMAFARFVVHPPYITIGELPNFSACAMLAERSMTHILGPLSVLAAQGRLPIDKTSSGIEAALKAYLIARQLNDDAHDWAEDFYAGHMTYVVTAILRDLHLPPGTYNMERLFPAMQACFWKTTVCSISKEVLQHVARCRKDLLQSGLFKEANPLEILLTAIEISATKTSDIQRKGSAFLYAYAQ